MKVEQDNVGAEPLVFIVGNGTSAGKSIVVPVCDRELISGRNREIAVIQRERRGLRNAS
jgi:hypothetical protein